MTLEEKIAMAQTIRSRDRFGPVSPEELAALPGTEKEMWVEVADGRKVHLFEERPEHLSAKAALLLNFHGGGFIKGRTDRDRRYCCTIMEQLNVLVWDVDYCIAPEEPFPAAVEEAYGIAAYTFDHAEELGIDPDKIILAGHSAGGNLVAAVCLKNAETHRLHPCCVLMEYFPTDNTVDPLRRLSPELQKDPFWAKRAETEKLYPGPALLPGKSCGRGTGLVPGQPDPLGRRGQPAGGCGGLCSPAGQGRRLRHSPAHPGGYARLYHQPDPRLGAGPGTALQILPAALIMKIERSKTGG